MSKVMRAIDAKSFIIGVLSAVVVCMAVGAGSNEKKNSNSYEIKILENPLKMLSNEFTMNFWTFSYA